MKQILYVTQHNFQKIVLLEMKDFAEHVEKYEFGFANCRDRITVNTVAVIIAFHHKVKLLFNNNLNSCPVSIQLQVK